MNFSNSANLKSNFQRAKPLPIKLQPQRKLNQTCDQIILQQPKIDFRCEFELPKFCDLSKIQSPPLLNLDEFCVPYGSEGKDDSLQWF